MHYKGSDLRRKIWCQSLSWLTVIIYLIVILGLTFKWIGTRQNWFRRMGQTRPFFKIPVDTRPQFSLVKSIHIGYLSDLDSHHTAHPIQPSSPIRPPILPTRFPGAPPWPPHVQNPEIPQVHSNSGDDRRWPLGAGRLLPQPPRATHRRRRKD